MTDPATSVSLLLAKSVGAAIGKKFTSLVIEKWTQYRAAKFFESYSIELAKALEAGKWGDLNQMTDEIFSDDLKTEILFDSYRRVCFTKSKLLGPRILGVLTAMLILEGRKATEEEEIIFECAEGLADPEFVEIVKFYFECLEKSKKGKPDVKEYGGEITIEWCVDGYDSTWGSSQADIGSLDFTEALGEWARKAKSYSLISDRIVCATSGSTNYGKRITETKYITYVTTRLAMKTLVEYVQRALAVSPPKDDQE